MMMGCLFLWKEKDGRHILTPDDLEMVGPLRLKHLGGTVTKTGSGYVVNWVWNFKIARADKYRFSIAFNGTLPTRETIDIESTRDWFHCTAPPA